ncbi:hypothetical protein LTR36_001168 [Oleoguttula mirabilis]|uniref:BTB domain-containing protein n=1 Tax=Oleoguttula mirabilis TaxID=1507867 RepID=A0AAV9J3J9_9PEZI|nr:hypothetical protein LTR36_001168 [Oleoguttula mirabilis]
MASTIGTSVFPHFADGDVKIVLSDDPQDTLTLHIATLAKGSDFFKASLERMDWSHNKYIRKEGDVQTEVGMKLLELDMDGSDTFPLLMGATFEPSAEKMISKRLEHDAPLGLSELTNLRYPSHIIVSAYKVGFALLYNLRVDLATDVKNIRASAQVIPAVVDFLDAYGLLPAYNPLISDMLFGGSGCGYDIIGQNPLRMLLVACKMQSQNMYQEAMKHAVGVHEMHNCEGSNINHVYSPAFFLDLGESEIHARFVQHTKDVHTHVENLKKQMLTTYPICCNKLGLARDVGLAIWRGWVIDHITTSPSHDGLLQLAKKDYDVSSIIRDWSTKDWDKDVGVRFGHVHRAVENCFTTATMWLWRGEGEGPKGKQFHDNKDELNYAYLRYYCYLTFDEDYEYPWAGKTRVPSYTLPTAKTTTVLDFGDAEI